MGALDGQSAAMEIPDVFTWGDTWQGNYLTDGDLGTESGKGYSSGAFGTSGNAEQDISQNPVTITFNLGSLLVFDTLKIYPRVTADSVSGQECANYPKNYTLQVSDDGQVWNDVLTNKEVGSVRNTVKYPDQDIYAGAQFEETLTQHLRIAVSELGPATGDDNENSLQIMELEVLDKNGKNSAADADISISTAGVTGVDQWAQTNLTDGDYGKETDRGYSSDILGRGSSGPVLDEPINIDLTFNSPVNVSEIKMFARTMKASSIDGVCPNYPKVYTVQTSEDGQIWTDIAQ